MPKKPTGLTPGKGQSSPVVKDSVPMKTPALKATNMPNPMNGGPNKVASLPGSRFPKLTKPAVMPTRTPRI